MTQQDHFNNILRHTTTLFSRWRGGYARMMYLSDSHKTLMICIERSKVRGNLHLACLGPIHIYGPVVWFDSDIEIVQGSHTPFIVRDLRAGLEIQTVGVEVRENCKPIFTPP